MPVCSLPVHTVAFKTISPGKVFILAHELGRVIPPRILRKVADGARTYGIPVILPLERNEDFVYVPIGDEEEVVPLR